MLQSFIGGIVAFRVLARPAFATLQSGLFPVYFTMQTVLPAVLALTYPGTQTLTRSVQSGPAGVMAEQNRWSVLVPFATMFLGGLSNLLVIGPATTACMRERKHQGEYDFGMCTWPL